MDLPMQLLKKLVAMRTVSSDPGAGPTLARAADFLVKTLSAMGFEATQGSWFWNGPTVCASRGREGAANSLVLYGHYDVQPEDPRDCWHSEPFQLTERNGLLYGRGVADDKGPIVAMLAAIGDIQNWDNLQLTVILEGGEEVGSPNFEDFLLAWRDRLANRRAVLSVDCGCPDAETPALTVGLRGLIAGEMTLRTAPADIHSGYGGCVPNAVQELVRLCSKFHREDGSVAIPHFYDGISAPGGEDLAAFRVPAEGKSLATTLGVKCLRNIFPSVPPDAVHAFFPALEWNGIWGGYAEEGSKTIIPAVASVKFSIRTVPGQCAEALCSALENFARENCPPYGDVQVQCVVHGPAYGVGGPSVGPEFRRLFGLLEDSVKREFGRSPLALREGGSIGAVGNFKKILGLDSLLLGVVPTSSHIHGPDENWPVRSFRSTRRALSLFFNSL